MINLSELLHGIEITATDLDGLPELEAPLWVGAGCQVSPEEYALQVPGVGSYYAADGKRVLLHAEPGADPKWVRLYLYGQVLVALLHQRKIINFHASGFVYDGRGVMIPGETGAGKSSVTLSFVLHGGGFLTDDLTPVVFEGEQPCILPLHRNVKIRKDTAEELGIGPDVLSEAESGTGKKYVNLVPVQMNPFPLRVIVKIETGPVEAPVFSEPSPSERFSLLRSEVCSWEILAGMPETEAVYLQQLLQIVEQVRIVRVVRPAGIDIAGFYEAVRGYLTEAESKQSSPGL